MSPADPQWLEGAPIYRQLRDRVIALILDGSLKEGDAVPSVRQVAADFRINPLTVMKAYQALSDEGLLEKRRGLGMFVALGAHKALLSDERARFLDTEWPRIRTRIQALGLDLKDLFDKEES
ncbi:MAG: GntR family transcriptional regulator [Steroidobacteraceae bacterium]